MKKIFRIFRLDLKSVTKNLIVFVVVIGITILPALYAWFNIASNWDPYSNTGNLPFAVYSEDKGYSYKTLKINAGDSIIEALKENDQMGWEFVDSEDEATDGVKSGKFYAAIIIPEDFSVDLLSITTGDFKQAKLEYYVNEKKNAVASLITKEGIEAIEGSIGSTYVDSLTKTIATALSLTEDEFDSSKEELSDKIITSLKDTKTDITTFNSSVDVMITTLDSIDDLIDTNKDLIPTIQSTLSSAGVFTTDISTTLSNTQGVASQISTSISGLVDNGETYMGSVSDQLDTAFSEFSDDADSLADKLQSVEVINKKIISVNNVVIGILTNIQSNLGIDCSKALTALNNANSKQNAIIDKIDGICDTISSTGKIPANAKSDLDDLISDANTEIADVESEYNAIKSDIDSKMSDSFSALDDVTDFLQTINSGTDQLNTTFDSAKTANSNLKDVLQNLKTFLNTVNDKIDTMITKVEDIEGSNLIENIITPIIENPDSLGKFVSSPVSYDTNSEYHLDNYGSAMAPFYSALALWVGGIVLVAVLNVDLTKKDQKKLGKANSVQLFFGRYMIFFVICEIQALIIALGDLFFLKIECKNHILFILTCMLSSFIYSLIIYSLTITFSVIGKALAVIILIMQVAGSGGTYPVEVLPAPFQAIAPFLPFYYGINALRETVCGVDMSSYLHDIAILSLYIIPALLLGLLLRKPCIKIIAFFNHKIEESDLVI